VTAEVDLEKSDTVRVLPVGVCDRVVVLTVVTTVGERDFLVEEGSSSVTGTVSKKLETKSSVTVVESSVTSDWKTSVLDGELSDSDG
jgi:hypothetical protein